jgi:LVIVD repeat
LAVALATMLVPLVVGSAVAAPPGNRPAVTVTAGTPSGASLSVTADVNRGTGDLASCSYVIDAGSAVSCGAPAARAKKASRYSIALANQTAGDHTITVTVLLKDGGRGSGSDDFMIAPQPPGSYDTSDNMRFVGFSERLSGSGLSNINTDLAFQGTRVYQGTFPGFRILDISDPSEPEQLVNYTDCRHPSGQGDVVIYGDILVRSWDSASSSGMPAGGWPCGDTRVQAGEEGLHVIDVSDPAQPDVETFIDLPCGSHTATAVPDPENGNLIIYSSPSSGACDGIDVVVIPLDDPAQASYDHFEPSADLIPCADTGVILGDVLRAACAGGQGFAVWSLDPADGASKIDPVLLYTKNLKVELGLNINTGVAAAFSNDGSTLIFGHEPDGGVQARCQATGTPLTSSVYPVQTDDMKSVFFFDTATGALEGQWTLPRDQTAVENCALANFHVVASEDRDIVVLGSYQAGIDVVDFADRENPAGIAYADPEPLNPNALTIGGDWASYYYRGLIWESDITRGLLSWEFLGDALGDTILLDRLNPQTQEFTTGQP